MEGPESPLDEPFSLGDWQVLPSLNRLRGSADDIQLEPRAMGVLVVLKEHAGEVVSRQRLHELAWPDVTVSEETLSRVIFDLRKALGDRADHPAYIETIRKVGYRLIAEVQDDVRDEREPGTTETQSPDEPPASTSTEWISSGTARALFLTGLGLLAVIGAKTDFDPPSLPPSALPDLPRTLQLTSYPGYETHPTISPDGRRLAFSWDGGGTNVDVYRRSVDEQEPVRLTDDPARDDNPQWSPDGRSLSFVRSDDRTCRLMRVAQPSEEVEALAECREAQISPPIWTPDGRGLIYSDRDAADEPFRLLHLDLETRATTRLTTPPFDAFGDLYPSLSTDGRRLAFVRATAKSTISTYLAPAIGDLFRLDLPADPSIRPPAPLRLTFDNQIMTGATWTDADRSLRFIARRKGRGYSIWPIPAVGGEPRLVSSPGGLLRFPVRAEPGKIVYERWDGRTDLWQIQLDGSAEPADERAVQASTRSDLNPRWRPDGAKIAFTSARTGNYEIWISEPDGSRARQMTRNKDFPAESPAWSPDGRRLAFEARRDGHSRIYTLEVDGFEPAGEPIPLTATQFDDRAPSWSRDGRWVYFGSNRSGAWQIWKVDSEGKGLTQVTRRGGFRALEAGGLELGGLEVGGLELGDAPEIDGTEPTALYFSKRNEPGIWRLGSSGEQELVAPLSSEHWGNWDLVGGTLYFIELRDRRTLIHRQRLPNGPVELVGVAEDWISRETPNLSIAPDGGSALFARFSGLAADLMMVDTGQRPGLAP